VDGLDWLLDDLGLGFVKSLSSLSKGKDLTNWLSRRGCKGETLSMSNRLMGCRILINETTIGSFLKNRRTFNDFR